MINGGRTDNIDEDALIKKYKRSREFFHIARTPFTLSKVKPTQLYILGFNVGGRPNGLWFSRGSTWLARTRELGAADYPPCCYIYKLGIDTRADILRISNDSDFREFDKSVPSYWLNRDYYEFTYVDYLTGKTIECVRRRDLRLEKLKYKRGESTRDLLLRHKLIFDNPRDAKKHCAFYREAGVPIERFKYKDWNFVGARYQGIIFDNWRMSSEAFKYFWFQSLDAPSGCIWDMDAIKSLNLAYNKTDTNAWACK